MTATLPQLEPAPPRSHVVVPPPLSVDELLSEQQDLTAVERFARAHEADTVPAQAKYYRDLIPLSQPAAGQQYAFEVDLDACSGCKACVSACHHLNGLEKSETWRWVGQLYGSEIRENSLLPVVQHVTTACHHCLEPACLAGCPTNAYEKDPDTGIVRHLDDQCFGCQYCAMACPYEVPQYSHEKGIVRKCDMCHGRLTVGEAPACVQSCPTQAIRISIVDCEEVIARTAANRFLPATPDANITRPATVYRREVSLAATVEAADTEFARPQHAHLPLVAMLVVTQMGVGALATALVGRWTGMLADPLAITVALGLGLLAMLLGLAIAPLHLGRPHLMFRSVLGWRHSWLSREAIVFGMIPPLAAIALLYAGWGDVLSLPEFGRLPVEIATVLVGAAGVFCSARIYQFCRREFWRGARTGLKFSLTAVLLGSATVALVVVALFRGTAPLPSALVLLFAVQIAAGMAQLIYETAVFAHAHNREGTLRLTARLLTRQLRPVTVPRFVCGALGGVVLPLWGVAACLMSPGDVPGVFALAVLGWAFSLVGEFAARYLFFAAVIPLRMPGGIA